MTYSTLSEQDKQTIVHGLRIAAERFDADQAVCAEAGHAGLVEQFQRQTTESRILANRIENAFNVCVDLEN